LSLLRYQSSAGHMPEGLHNRAIPHRSVGRDWSEGDGLIVGDGGLLRAQNAPGRRVFRGRDLGVTPGRPLPPRRYARGHTANRMGGFPWGAAGLSLASPVMCRLSRRIKARPRPLAPLNVLMRRILETSLRCTVGQKAPSSISRSNMFNQQYISRRQCLRCVHSKFQSGNDRAPTRPWARSSAWS
jgi:hypothetical protein